jgi:hypothetical protein
MPTETERQIKRKRIKLPSGDTVDIPVITQITFKDTVERGQEYQFTIDNTAAAHRDVHTASIPGNGGATDETGNNAGLKVERVDLWRTKDTVERGQQTYYAPDSKTIAEPPSAPPFFTTHEKTHIVKYINTPDDGNWLKSELIDKFKFKDTVERGQETEYFLSNPPDNQNISGLTIGSDSDGTTVAIDPGIAEIADTNGNPDPVRTDPFQNIVDFNGTARIYLYRWYWFYSSWNITGGPGDAGAAITFATHLDGYNVGSTDLLPYPYILFGVSFTRTTKPPPLGSTEFNAAIAGSWGGVAQPQPATAMPPGATYGARFVLLAPADAFVPTIPYSWVNTVSPYDEQAGGVAKADFSGLSFIVGSTIPEIKGINACSRLFSSVAGGAYGPSGSAIWGPYGPYKF